METAGATAGQRGRASHRVVIIEDEPDILEVLRYNLEREGFRVAAASNGIEGINPVRGSIPDLVLLDLLRPGLDGLEVCRGLRSGGTTREIPIIMITAKGEEADVVLGLGLGADDYITKPFSPKEVVARARAVMRRGAGASEHEPPRQLVFGELLIDPRAHRVAIAGAEQRFTATEFRLLAFLAANPGRVFTRDQLIDKAIGDGAAVIDRNIDVPITSVRKNLGVHRDLIVTVRGVGYRFGTED